MLLDYVQELQMAHAGKLAHFENELGKQEQANRRL